MKKALTIFLFSIIILCGAIQADYPQLASQSLARVIYATQDGESQGSGVVLKQQYVLTCYHIVKDKGPGNFTIIITTGEISRNLDAEIIKVDPEKDLMLLKLSESIPWKTVHLAKKIKWGEMVYFGGYSALPLPILRIGFVAQRYKQGLCLHPIYFGDSGGGVFNQKQELIGIIYLLYSVRGIPSLVGYAIPLEDLQEFLSNELR